MDLFDVVIARKLSGGGGGGSSDFSTASVTFVCTNSPWGYNAILMAGWYYNGPEEPRWYAAIYETLGDAEPDDPEADLGLVAISPGFFQDEGHAIEWAINTIT